MFPHLGRQGHAGPGHRAAAPPPARSSLRSATGLFPPLGALAYTRTAAPLLDRMA